LKPANFKQLFIGRDMVRLGSMAPLLNTFISIRMERKQPNTVHFFTRIWLWYQ